MNIAIMLASGFLLTRITKRLRLPDVTGYIISGVIIGPWCLKLIAPDFIEQMDFVTDLALAFIAFGVGKYFKLSALKANGKNMVILTLFEALIAFSVCAAFVQAGSKTGHISAGQIILPIIFNISALALGVLSGILLSYAIHRGHSKDHSLVLACVCIMGVAGICSSMDVSPLLACMATGTAYINTSGNKHLFKQIDQFTPPLLVIFFVLCGMRLSIPSLAAAGMIGLVYFLVRIAGKYVGSTIGAIITNASSEIRRYFGLALIPQAGVSIGLAVLGQRMLPSDSGTLLSTIILSSGLLYEIIGPACSKLAIKKSGSIPVKENK